MNIVAVLCNGNVSCCKRINVIYILLTYFTVLYYREAGFDYLVNVPAGLVKSTSTGKCLGIWEL